MQGPIFHTVREPAMESRGVVGFENGMSSVLTGRW